jgi:hypothetical protein
MLIGIVSKQGRVALTQVFPEAAEDAALPLLFRRRVKTFGQPQAKTELSIFSLQGKQHFEEQSMRYLHRKAFLHQRV